MTNHLTYGEFEITFIMPQSGRLEIHMENQNNTFDFTGAAGAVSPEITRLTGTAAEEKPITETAPEEEKEASLEDSFSEEEIEVIKTFSEKINIMDSSAALSYGAAAQKKISDFSDSALNGAKTKDFGDTGEMISNLLIELRGIDEPEEKRGFLGLFKKTKNKIEAMKVKYSKAEESVNGIVEVLESHQITLMKDIAVFDNLYQMNLDYLKELSMYIAAGKLKLKHERDVTLPAIKQFAERSGKPEDAQAAHDFEDRCRRFERRLHDLELTRTVAIQTAPQIRLLQNNDTMMSEKIQTVIMNTIPLWKSQMVLALGIAHSAEALEAQKNVTDMTNELLRQNASKLHQATVGIAKESERGIVDIETLTATNEELIKTLDEVKQIQTEAGERRRSAEKELRRIERELKNKLLEIEIPNENKNN